MNRIATRPSHFYFCNTRAISHTYLARLNRSHLPPTRQFATHTYTYHLTRNLNQGEMSISLQKSTKHLDAIGAGFHHLRRGNLLTYQWPAPRPEQRTLENHLQIAWPDFRAIQGRQLKLWKQRNPNRLAFSFQPEQESRCQKACDQHKQKQSETSLGKIYSLHCTSSAAGIGRNAKIETCTSKACLASSPRLPRRTALGVMTRSSNTSSGLPCSSICRPDMTEPSSPPNWARTPTTV